MHEHRPVPQDATRRHVPVVHGDARGGARHPRPRERARAARCRSPTRTRRSATSACTRSSTSASSARRASASARSTSTWRRSRASSCPTTRSIHGTPLRSRVFGAIRALNRAGAALAPLSNLARRACPARGRCSSARSGSPRERPLPRFERETLLRWYARRDSAGRRRRRAATSSCSPTRSRRFTEPEIGRAAVELLERAGWRVRLAERRLLRPGEHLEGPARTTRSGWRARWSTASRPTRARGHADRRRRAVLPAHPARRVPRRCCRATRAPRRSPGRRTSSTTCSSRRSTRATSSCGRLAARRAADRLPRPLPPEGGRRHGGDARAARAHPGRRGGRARRRLLRHGGLVRLRGRALRPVAAGRRAPAVPGAARRAGGHGRRGDRRLVPPADRALRRPHRAPPGGARGRGGRARRAARRDLARPAAVARRRRRTGRGRCPGGGGSWARAGSTSCSATGRSRPTRCARTCPPGCPSTSPRARRGSRSPRSRSARPGRAASRRRPPSALPRAQRPHVRHPRRAARGSSSSASTRRARSRSATARRLFRLPYLRAQMRSRATGRGRTTAASAATRGARRRASRPDSGRRAPRDPPRPGRSRNGSSSATASTRPTPAAGCWRATSTTGRGPCATPRPRSAPTR